MYPMADNISGLGDQIVAVLCNNVPTGQQSGKYYGLIGGGFTSTAPTLNADKVYESTITLIPSVYCNQFSGDTGIMHKVLSAQTTDGLKFVVKYDSAKKMWKPAEGVKQMAIWVTCDKHEIDTPVPTEFTITVTSGGNGTASASHAKAVAGTEIRLTATPKTGYHFKEWEVISGGVTIKDDKFLMPNDNVEVKAIFEEDAPPAPTEFTITVKTDGNGTASASHAKAVVGTEITLTATPNAGYHFKEWQVMSGDVTVRDDKFTMPSDNVEIKAIFEEDAPPTPTEYTVTFDGNDGTPSVGSMTTTKQKLTSLPDASRSKHSFNGWYTEKSGGTKITTDTVFSANTTVYAHWTHTGDNNPPVNYYTLRFETGGGSAIPGVRETYNTYMDLTKYVPTRHGYTFVGWYSEQSLVNKVSDIYLTGDRTVYAGWRAVTIPQTGDSGQMNLWSTALCASFAGCVALIVWKIRRREKKSL